ncbi:hypothetical protein MASR2M36_14370 [Providencia sp.]
MYHTDYKDFKTIQFRVMPPFYFVTQKLRGSGFSFPKATNIAKISSMVILLQIMNYFLFLIEKSSKISVPSLVN